MKDINKKKLKNTEIILNCVIRTEPKQDALASPVRQAKEGNRFGPRERQSPVYIGIKQKSFKD